MIMIMIIVLLMIMAVIVMISMTATIVTVLAAVAALLTAVVASSSIKPAFQVQSLQDCYSFAKEGFCRETQLEILTNTWHAPRTKTFYI